MDRSQFLELVKTFDTCGIVVITGDDFGKTYALACDAKTSVESAGQNSLVYDAETLVAYTRDAYAGRSLEVWEKDRKYYAGEYVIPTSMRDDYIIFSRPFDCASSIQQRFRFKCVQTGLSSRTEPSWPTTEGTYVSDRNARWVSEAFSGSVGTFGNETGLVWEWVSLAARDNYVVFAPKGMDSSNALTGNVITDSVVDIMMTERPAFWPYQSLFWSLTREIFPYMVVQYHYDTDAGDDDPNAITLVKRQQTQDGCDW